jgi:hypothetical protein
VGLQLQVHRPDASHGHGGLIDARCLIRRVLDADGNLTYIGDDGRRYVVAPPPQQGG